ncbi:hypothetical protein HPB52_015183 [Rhipicephalus sanguineus]|uniref:C2H2-type domain-containing protein n=1 Tax=Rhipicephalus sanguineus TaxID=34632 RepID=A0A9D4SMY1_RHISA|nr:hypothetical protein HPB52_015183 [Rhipicephalus sanguineus]
MTCSSNNVDARPGNPSSSLEQLNNPPALPFSLKPVPELDALEQVVEQEKDAVLISRSLEVAEEGRQDGLGNNNADEPPFAHAVHAKGVQRKRRIYAENVANDAKVTRRSERFHGSSLDKAESSPAPTSITESDYGPGTSRPKLIRAATRHPPQYDPSDNGAPSRNAPKGAACQKSAHGNPSSSLEQLNNPPALPFSLKPVPELDALEQVVEQEKDAILISRSLEVAEEGRQDGLGNNNADEPPFAQCVADPASGGDLVIDEIPDPASGADLVTNESPGHLSKENIPNNDELPPSTPSAVHAKGVQRKRRIYAENVANDAKVTRRSERFHGSSLDKAESSPAPTSITESDYGPGTSRPKLIRAATRHPPQYDPSDNGAPSRNAPKGAACQKSAHGAGATKTWQCPSCSKVLSRKSCLNRHRQLVHEGSRPLKCPHCPKSFGLRDSLRSHIRRTLKRHLLTHVDDWPHQCEVCDKRFRELRTLRNHARSRHPTEISFD